MYSLRVEWMSCFQPRSMYIWIPRYTKRGFEESHQTTPLRVKRVSFHCGDMTRYHLRGGSSTSGFGVYGLKPRVAMILTFTWRKERKGWIEVNIMVIIVIVIISSIWTSYYETSRRLPNTSRTENVEIPILYRYLNMPRWPLLTCPPIPIKKIETMYSIIPSSQLSKLPWEIY